jgi:hypothetical protein
MDFTDGLDDPVATNTYGNDLHDTSTGNMVNNQPAAPKV